jgi:hypothetical protein
MWIYQNIVARDRKTRNRGRLSSSKAASATDMFLHHEVGFFAREHLPSRPHLFHSTLGRAKAGQRTWSRSVSILWSSEVWISPLSSRGPMYVVAAVPRVLPRIEGVCRHLAERCQIVMVTGKDYNSTYDHRSVKTGHPVRSAIHKH